MFTYLNGWENIVHRSSYAMTSFLHSLSLSIYLSMHQYRCCFSKPSLCLLMFLPTSSAFRYHDSMTAKRQIIVYMHLSYMCLSVHFNAPVICVRCVCMSEMWNADGEMVLMLMMMMWWYETHQNMGNYVWVVGKSAPLFLDDLELLWMRGFIWVCGLFTLVAFICPSTHDGGCCVSCAWCHQHSSLFSF